MSSRSLIVLAIVGCAALLVSSAPGYEHLNNNQPQQPYRHPQLPQQPEQGHPQPIVHHPVPPQHAGSGPPSAFTGNQPIVDRPYPDGQAPPMNPILNNQIGDCDEEGNPLPAATTGTANPLDIGTASPGSTTESSSTTEGSSTPSGASTSTGGSSTTEGSSTTGSSSSSETSATGLPTLLPTLPTLPTLLPTITTGAPLTLPTLVPTAPSSTATSRRRRATEEQKMKMGKVMKLVEMVKLQDCVARVICALNCAPDAYGPDGKKVFSMMLQVQTSGTVNETETKYYISAAMNGRRYREAKECDKCNVTYCNCEATSQDLIDVVSLVNLDN